MPESELLDGWSRFFAHPGSPFFIPGHKHRSGELWPELGAVNAGDAPLFGALASLKEAAPLLAAAESRTATRWGADWCRYSTGGSTHANQAVALAVGQHGDEVLVARNAHRSTLSGLMLAGLTPRWISPEVTDGVITGISSSSLREAMAQHPAARALFLVEPSYVGTLSERTELIEIAHAAGLIVVVDQAWGAHLGFHPDLPPHALALGADALVFSAHKTLPAYTQASIVLARTERLDANRLDRAFDLCATTSPAGTILASTDAAVALLDSDLGRARLGDLVATVAQARSMISAASAELPIAVLEPDEWSLDPTKLVIRLPRGGGLAIEQALIAAGLGVEQADETTIIPIVTLVDDSVELQRLVQLVLTHLHQVAPTLPTVGPNPTDTKAAALPPTQMSPRDAFFAETETVSADDAVGRISAEVIAPYPPGVPVLVPGEEITGATIEALTAAAVSGQRIAYAADPSLASFHVVRETSAGTDFKDA